MYPLVYHQSQILASGACGVDNIFSWIGKGQRLHTPPYSEALGPEWSAKYQWLPSEFDLTKDTEEVVVKSYINNLHPTHHSELYTIISKVVAKAIPLWNRVLSCVNFGPIPQRVDDWSNSDGFGYSKSETEEPEMDDDEDYDDYEERLETWRDARNIIEPEPGSFKPPLERIRRERTKWGSLLPPDLRSPPDTDPSVDLRNDFGRLQIIVKLANIQLTPANPSYPGGSWHVEGQANESMYTSPYVLSGQSVDFANNRTPVAPQRATTIHTLISQIPISHIVSK